MCDALLAFGAVFALALLRVPLAFAMGAVGFVGLGLLRGWAPTAASAAQVVVCQMPYSFSRSAGASGRCCAWASIRRGKVGSAVACMERNCKNKFDAGLSF